MKLDCVLHRQARLGGAGRERTLRCGDMSRNTDSSTGNGVQFNLKQQSATVVGTSNLVTTNELCRTAVPVDRVAQQ